jgi:hypothetical protein
MPTVLASCRATRKFGAHGHVDRTSTCLAWACARFAAACASHRAESAVPGSSSGPRVPGLDVDPRADPTLSRFGYEPPVTRPSSQTYHVAVVCGEASGWSVAITAGLGCDRNSSSCRGSGDFGMHPRIPGQRQSDAERPTADVAGRGESSHDDERDRLVPAQRRPQLIAGPTETDRHVQPYRGNPGVRKDWDCCRGDCGTSPDAGVRRCA